MALHPVDDEAIRREQPHELPVLDELQRPYPRIELLLRQVSLEAANALTPKRQANRRVLCHGESLRLSANGRERGILVSLIWPRSVYPQLSERASAQQSPATTAPPY